MERKLSVMLIAVFCLLFGGKALAQSTVSGTVFSSEDDSPILVLPSKFRVLKWVPQLISMESSVWRM